MTRHWKKASVGTSLALAAVALAGYAYTRDHTEAAPAYQLANGIGVTPIDTPQDDTDRLLGVHIWKFDVRQPDQSRPLILSFSECRKGIFVKTIASCGSFGPDASHPHLHEPHVYHVVVGMMPIGGTPGAEKQLKYNIAVDGSNVSNLLPNILLSREGAAWGTQVSAPDNLIYLISTNKDHTPVTSDAFLDDINLALSVGPRPSK